MNDFSFSFQHKRSKSKFHLDKRSKDKIGMMMTLKQKHRHYLQCDFKKRFQNKLTGVGLKYCDVSQSIFISQGLL